MAEHSQPMTPRRLHRRGVLLLIVLSMLSLFMMLGVAYVVMASRARDASRGFAKVIAPAADSRLPINQLLDSAAMLLIRGTPTGGSPPAALPGASTFLFESLLDDQYGTADTLTGLVTTFEPYPPLCSVSVSLNAASTPPTSAVELSGRILTFLPAAGKPSSHRILRATPSPNGGYTLWIANVGNAFSKQQQQGGSSTTGTYKFPPAGTTIVINSRAHSGGSPANEAWDAFDFASNSFLAQVEPVPATPSATVVVRASMFDASGLSIDSANDVDVDGVSDDFDNDNDGIVDGQFFDPGFPPIAAANGNNIVTHMSCLIVDLDGRLNVNAHGSIASAIYPSSHSGWLPTIPPGGWTGIPMGSGYGPGDVSVTGAMAAFNSDRPFPGHDDPWTSIVLGAAPSMQYASGDRQGQSATAPDPGCRLLSLVLPALEGRYAGIAGNAPPLSDASLSSLVASPGALPGVPGLNDLMSQHNERQFAGVRSQIDLHGRMKSRAIAASSPAVVPTLSFAKPDSSDEFTDEPYEVILNQTKSGGILADPRTAGQTVGSAPDNIFSIAELERVLRPYDPDSQRLPPRLFALLGSQAEISRTVVTTESWDVPAVVGTVASTLFGPSGWFSGVTPQSALYSTLGPSSANPAVGSNGVVPSDLAAGLRLDITRPLTTDQQRRELFKDIYLTCVALLTAGGNNPTAADAARYAQWAANVIEYQDADSTMTQYEYDPEPRDGWDVDGDPSTTTEPDRQIVWGAERPEVVITQTLAWDDGTNGELYVMLHRPWNSRIEIPGSPAGAAEPSDPVLLSPTATDSSSIDLSGRSPAGEPIWRIRIGTGNTDPIVRFDQLPVGSSDLGATVAPAPPPPFVSEFRPDSWICVGPPAPSTEGVVVPPGAQNLSITNGTLKAPLGTTAIRLERLANPASNYNSTSNPYLIVDAAGVTVVNRTPVAPPLTLPPHEVRTRDLGWRQQFNSSPHASNPPLSMAWGGSPAWMMWPNRPLVSVVELMHVPGFAANSFVPQSATSPASPNDGMLANYSPPVGVAYLPDPLLLDVFRVPSRFAGTRLTIPSTANASFLTNLEQIGIYSPIVSVNQLDLAREPGRVNLNTISSDAVWNDVVGGSGMPGSTVPSRTAANLAAVQPSTGLASPASPAETLLNVLSMASGNTATAPFANTNADIPDAHINPLHGMHTATRLANTATNRSHLFAVWITLRTMEQTPGAAPVTDQDTVRYHRMFFIYDRSKPVAFEAGRDHNVRDGILLNRVLQ
jgi:hypothetical protein